MKKFYPSIILSLFLTVTGFTQSTIISPGGTTENIKISGQKNGLGISGLTTQERDAIQNPAGGYVIYNTTVNCLEFYNGSYWYNLCGVNLSNGLVAYYPFNGNANDVSGNGNHGQVNGATLTTDRFGNSNKAYSFNQNYILVPQSTSFNFINFSISLWVSTTNSNLQVALKQNNFQGATNERFSVAFNDLQQNGIQFAAKYNSPNCSPGIGWQKNEIIQNILNGSFHHIVATVNGNTIKLYIDGLLVNTLTTPYNQSSLCYGGDIQIGREWSSFPNFFQGKIDDIGIWNRALTQQEITHLYQNLFNP